MIVCLCREVADHTIRAVVATGARTIRDVAETCGAGTDCLACGPMLQELIQRAHGSMYSDARASRYISTGERS